MKLKRLLTYGLVIIIIETLLFALWIYNEKPDPSVSIALVLIIPIIFGLNILIGLVLYFLKRKQLANLLFINSIIAPLILYILWTWWFIGWRERNYSEYSFSIANSKYILSLSTTSDFFDISDVTNQSNGSTTGLYFGKYQIKGDSIILTDGQTKIFMVKEQLVGFPSLPKAIDLKIIID